MPLYELHNVTYSYGDRTALAIDRWSIEDNRITGLAGPNGSGKSTLLGLLGFVSAPSGGELLFNGKKVSPFTGSCRHEVTLFPQDGYLLKRSVAGNIAYGLKIRNQPYKGTNAIAEALALVGLDAAKFAQRPWFALSGGEARRVALAARLVLRPRVLLLDEPTTSVDAASAQSIKNAALQAHRLWGTSLIISSHDMPWLQEICHEIVFLFNGRIIGSGLPTLLFGPWQDTGNGLLAMQLDNHQRFLAARRERLPDTPVASIDPARLALFEKADQIPPDREHLEGMILSMGMEKRTDHIHTAVQVGATVFNILLDPQTVSRYHLAPGRSVHIAYCFDDVVWHSGLPAPGA